MTQATQSAPAAPPAAAPALPAVAQTGSAPAAASYTEDVPRLLNRLQVLAVAACLIFGVAAAVVQVLAWQANGRAADNTSQVVRVQQIQSQLLRADAIATNGFLIGGLEPAAARAEFDASIDDVLRLITEAAETQPADRDVLARLNSRVTEYTTAVAQARDYNRQQFPIGIAYLNSASDALRDPEAQYSAQNMLNALASTNSDRAVDEMDAQHPWWILGVGVVALVALWLVNRQIARRFHRRLNIGVAIAAGALAVVTLATAAHAQNKHDDNESTQAGPYRTAVDEAQARTAANDAKAQESQGLINRGAGASFEAEWQTQADVVDANASARTLALWGDYVDYHQAIRDADDAGDWDAARDLAISSTAGSATAALDEVDHESERVIAESADDATGALRGGGFTSLLLIVLTLLGAVVAAAAATWGINQRRREYS